MHSMKFKEIAEQIAINSFLEEPGDFELQDIIEYISEKVDIIGKDNKDLRNPLNLDKNCSYFRDREIPLTGNEIVFGDYLLFDYVGHNEEMYLRQYDHLEDLEKDIIGRGGITNSFTTYLIPIIMGEIKKYNIYFVNAIHGKKYKFVKGVNDALLEYHSTFSEAPRKSNRKDKIRQIEIEWVV